MSGNTVTHEVTSTVPTAATMGRAPFSQSRAARELGLKRGEFDLAVHLGHIRTRVAEGGNSRQVDRSEVERLRGEEDFPEALRKRVATVGTREGSAIMEVTVARFTRLARLGLLVPVAFHLNRYRAVVWRYLADELCEFAGDAKNAPLLSRPLPERLRGQLDTGLDLRPRNWRGRHLGFLLGQAGDPWERAGALASLLDLIQISEIVTDPYERSHLSRFRPPPPAHGTPGSPAAHLTERITTAQDPDEIGLLRADLERAVREARIQRAAPRPASRHPDPHPHHDDSHRHPDMHRHPDTHRHRDAHRDTDAHPRSARHRCPPAAEHCERRRPVEISRPARGLLGRLFRRAT
ncbi:DUF6397 family protein [Streptomyces sp. NPDC088817]|uniref:DUF6397 family protein n=1 Tax=unclassified Streptomyces TaxID=2593676 RepID=UPI0036E7BD2A